MSNRQISNEQCKKANYMRAMQPLICSCAAYPLYVLNNQELEPAVIGLFSSKCYF